MCQFTFWISILLYFLLSTYSVDLLSVSLRSWATIQVDSPGITRTDPPRKPRSRSLCSRRRSSSSSRRNTSAGLSRIRNKAHTKHKDTTATVETSGLRFVDQIEFLDKFMFCLNIGTRKLRREIFESVLVLWLQTLSVAYREHVIYSVFLPKCVHSETIVAWTSLHH